MILQGNPSGGKESTIMGQKINFTNRKEMISKFNLVYLHLKEKLLVETLNQVSILLKNNLK
jgi:hypothetical protein